MVLVTDGIESCDGDPIGSAQALQRPDKRLPIHVIGFALGESADVAAASLQGIASASGGRFFLAGNAQELRRALMETAGTPFTLWLDGNRVAEGTLGVDRTYTLSKGDYLLRLESDPPREFPFSLNPEEAVDFTVSKTGAIVQPREIRRSIPWSLCE